MCENKPDELKLSNSKAEAAVHEIGHALASGRFGANPMSLCITEVEPDVWTGFYACDSESLKPWQAGCQSLMGVLTQAQFVARSNVNASMQLASTNVPSLICFLRDLSTVLPLTLTFECRDKQSCRVDATGGFRATIDASSMCLSCLTVISRMR